FGEPNLLLRRRQPRHVVGMRAAVEAQHVLLRLRQQRHLGQIVRRVAATASATATAVGAGARTTAAGFGGTASTAGRTPDDELVDAPGFLVEEGGLTGEAERAIQRPVLLVRRQ